MFFDLNPGVATFTLDDSVGNHALVLLGRLRVERESHQALDCEDGALGIGDTLALGHAAHTALTVFGERHDRRCGAAAFGVWDHLWLPVVDKRDARVGRSQIDPDDLPHLALAFFIPRGGGLSHLTADYSLVPSPSVDDSPP